MGDPGPAVTSAGRLLSIRRVSVCLAAGAVAGMASAVLGAPELSALLCWIVAAGLILFLVWRISWPQSADGTERLAEAESRSRFTDSAVLIASVVSLAAVVEALIRSSGPRIRSRSRPSFRA